MYGASGDNSHRAAVDSWLARTIGQRAAPDVVGLFDAAFERVWRTVVTALGRVTLIAIAERVLHDATARYSFLSVVNPRPNGDGRWREVLLARLATVPRAELIEGLRFSLIELLTVIGSLTAEILSDELHAALVASAASAGSGAGADPIAFAAEDAS